VSNRHPRRRASDGVSPHGAEKDVPFDASIKRIEKHAAIVALKQKKKKITMPIVSSLLKNLVDTSADFAAGFSVDGADEKPDIDGCLITHSPLNLA